MPISSPPSYAQDEAAAMRHEAALLATHGRYQEAAGMLEEFARRFPQHVDTQEVLMTLAGIQNDHLASPQQALETYEEVIDYYYPESPFVQQALMRSAILLIHLDRPSDAYLRLERIPENSQLYDRARALMAELSTRRARSTPLRNKRNLIVCISILEVSFTGIWLLVGRAPARSKRFWLMLLLVAMILSAKAYFNFLLYNIARG